MQLKEPLPRPSHGLLTALPRPVVVDGDGSAQINWPASQRFGQLNPVDERMVPSLSSKDGHRMRRVPHEDNPALRTGIDVPAAHRYTTTHPVEDAMRRQGLGIEQLRPRIRQLAGSGLI